MQSRVFESFPIDDFRRMKWKMLNWANQFNIFCLLDNHEYQVLPQSYECLLAVGARESLQADAGEAFDRLREFSRLHSDWLFGHFGYDLKNETEACSSGHPDGIQFPDLHFFVPEFILELRQGHLRIGTLHEDQAVIFRQISQVRIEKETEQSKISGIRSRFSRDEYIETVRSLGHHILRGDCYEVNFCQEFFAEGEEIDPASVYRQLSNASPSPFAAYYRLEDKWLLCASPERYLKKTGDRILAQPIKGTRSRVPENQEQDRLSRENLYYSGKDRSENVMVVDLVRNDLSKICQPGSVQVDELYGVYSFPQVHQMISSISGRADPSLSWVDLVRATFPMGSMTGAPKKRVLELIEQYENRKRGLFSGAVGYVTPGGDFDFNVVIRSILYNRLNRYLSYQTGSAITFYSDPVLEYEECLLKGAVIKKVLAG
jgi:para-aminobenzoate synthetase component I